MPLTLVNVKKLEKITAKDKKGDQEGNKELDIDYSNMHPYQKVAKPPAKDPQKNEEAKALDQLKDEVDLKNLPLHERKKRLKAA